MRKVKRSLKKLGGTSSEVHDTLTKLGIKGSPFLAGDCPIANYLTGTGLHDVVVGCLFASCQSKSWLRGYPFVATTPLPEPVHAFMMEFDRRGYPDLIA